MDPYAFAPVLGPLDDYLLVEGTHRRLYQRLGAHLLHHQGVDGVHFAVWRRTPRRCSVVRRLQFLGRPPASDAKNASIAGCGEIFLPGLGEGVAYKYRIRGPDGWISR